MGGGLCLTLPHRRYEDLADAAPGRARRGLARAAAEKNARSH